MKKIFYLVLCLLILTGCSNKLKDDVIDDNDSKAAEEVDIPEEIEEEEKYIDTNPIKISLYKEENGVYKKQYVYESKVVSLQEIGIFSIILSNEDEVALSSIKSLYNSKKNEYSNFDNYKIGFNVKFTLNDGTLVNENILRPLLYANYGFCHYLYAWIYDDVNTSGRHSHIEEDEFNDETVMSSIKLMWGKTADQIASDVELSVFTYDEDDFDENGNYRGVSKFTTIIERS